MNKYDTEKALQDYEAACNYIAEVFVNKQFGENKEEYITFENHADDLWWVGNHIGGVLGYFDNTFGFDDILTDLRRDAAPGAIIRYTDYVVHIFAEHHGHEKPMNYSTWLYTES